MLLGGLNTSAVGVLRLLVTPELPQGRSQTSPSVPLIVGRLKIQKEFPNACFEIAGGQVLERQPEAKARVIRVRRQHLLEGFDP